MYLKTKRALFHFVSFFVSGYGFRFFETLLFVDRVRTGLAGACLFAVPSTLELMDFFSFPSGGVDQPLVCSYGVWMQDICVAFDLMVKMCAYVLYASQPRPSGLRLSMYARIRGIMP